MDNLEVIYNHTGESKNCYIYEPEDGADVIGKIYVRKSAIAGPPPVSITMTLNDNEADHG